MKNIEKNTNLIGYTKNHINGYEVFVPKSFPPDFKEVLSNTEISIKADKAQHLIGKLAGVTNGVPDIDYFISAYITKDATASSQIEGTKATMIEAFEYSEESFNGLENDADDIAFYIKALNYGLEKIKEIPLSNRLIKGLHKKLMFGARSSHFSDPGNFRKTQNWINGTNPSSATFVPPAVEDMTQALQDLEKFLHDKNYNPIVQAGIIHAQFETVHPFLDGNGRTGRLLITFFLLERKLLDVPSLFLSSFFKKHQQMYYKKLSDYHFGNIESWIIFFLDAVIDTAEQAIKVSLEIGKLRERDMLKVSAFGKESAEKSLIILQNLFRNPVMSTTKIKALTGYSTRSGVIRLIDKLIAVNILYLYKKSEGVNPSVYIYKEYLDIFSEK